MTGAYGLAALRQAMTDYLTAQGVESMTAWPKDRVGALTAPLAVVQVKEVKAGSAGFQNYLGQRYDAETRSWTEAFGQKVSVKFLVTLYSPRQDGERGCRALLDRVAEAFLRGGPEGFAVEKWSVGETGFDRESGSFRGKLQAVCRGMLTALVKILLANGAARVLAVPVADENGYEAAFALVQEQEGVNVVICDSEKLAVQQKLRDSVMSASAERREGIAVVAGAAGETAEALVKRAGELNSERVVLVAPAVSQEAGGAWVAAAVAGAICGGSDPALPLGGAELQGISALEKRLDESEVDALIRGGVTPVERVGGSCWVIRGVTTRTKTGQASDRTWRDLTTILVVDDVIPGVREALRARFPRAKNTAQTRGAVQSLVVEVLERKLAAEVITGYDAVEVTALADEPGICLVTFGFTVTHGMDQIWLSAEVTV